MTSLYHSLQSLHARLCALESKHVAPLGVTPEMRKEAWENTSTSLDHGARATIQNIVKNISGANYVYDAFTGFDVSDKISYQVTEDMKIQTQQRKNIPKSDLFLTIKNVSSFQPITRFDWAVLERILVLCIEDYDDISTNNVIHVTLLDDFQLSPLVSDSNDTTDLSALRDNIHKMIHDPEYYLQAYQSRFGVDEDTDPARTLQLSWNLPPSTSRSVEWAWKTVVDNHNYKQPTPPCGILDVNLRIEVRTLGSVLVSEEYTNKPLTIRDLSALGFFVECMLTYPPRYGQISIQLTGKYNNVSFSSHRLNRVLHDIKQYILARSPSSETYNLRPNW